MIDMMTYCRHHPVDEILQIPDVAERVRTYILNEEFAEMQIKRCAEITKNVIMVDLRGEDTLYTVNRFLVYALFPKCNISVHLTNLPDRGLVEVAVGKSILDRSNKANVGSICLKYGGGGHAAVGTCQIEPEHVGSGGQGNHRRNPGQIRSGPAIVYNTFSAKSSDSKEPSMTAPFSIDRNRPFRPHRGGRGQDLRFL